MVLLKRKRKTARLLSGLLSSSLAAVTDMNLHHPKVKRDCPPAFCSHQCKIGTALFTELVLPREVNKAVGLIRERRIALTLTLLRRINNHCSHGALSP